MLSLMMTLRAFMAPEAPLIHVAVRVRLLLVQWFNDATIQIGAIALDREHSSAVLSAILWRML